MLGALSDVSGSSKWPKFLTYQKHKEPDSIINEPTHNATYVKAVSNVKDKLFRIPLSKRLLVLVKHVSCKKLKQSKVKY